jgi:uncharacterized protein (TIGR03083 family)
VLLTPRYDGEPVLAVEVRAPGPHPVVQQRARLEALLADLGADEWAHPSRCDAWTVQDVVVHLDSTNRFWAFSIEQGLAGEPTRFLASFDPVASPADLVDSTRGTAPEATLEAFSASNAALRQVVEALDDAGWDTLGEAPPGHLPIRLVADHALWDCWVHERDIALPLGRVPEEDPGEVLTCLRYAAGLGRAFDLSAGRDASGAAHLDLTAPDERIVVEVGTDRVRTHGGDAPEGAAVVSLAAVPALEMLSRRDAGQPVPPIVDWLTAGTAVVFDQAQPAEAP